MKMLFILLTIKLFCFPLIGKDIEYKSKKLPLDTTVYYHILKLEETITLEENDSIILSSISDIKLNFDNSEILICDKALKSVLNYNYENGNYIKSIKSGLYIQHDLALTYDKPVKTWLDEPCELVDTTRYKDIGLSKQFIDAMLISSFNRILYDNENNLELLTYLTIPASTFSKKSNQIFNLPINVKFNKNNNSFSTFSLFNFDSLSYFPLTNNGIKINNEYYLPSVNDNFLYYYRRGEIKTEIELKKFNLSSLTRHDSIGNIISIVGWVPDSYQKSNLFYQFMDIYMANVSDDIYYTYSYENKMFKENDSVAFEFKNLPYISINGLKNLSKENYKKRRMSKYLTPNEIGQYCPVSMIKLLNRKNNLLALFTVYEEEHPLKMYYILQEYTTEGELLSQTYFDDHPEKQIKNVFYDSKNDYLCFLRKSKKGWTVEKRSFK